MTLHDAAHDPEGATEGRRGICGRTQHPQMVPTRAHIISVRAQLQHHHGCSTVAASTIISVTVRHPFGIAELYASFSGYRGRLLSILPLSIRASDLVRRNASFVRFLALGGIVRHCMCRYWYCTSQNTLHSGAGCGMHRDCGVLNRCRTNTLTWSPALSTAS